MQWEVNINNNPPQKKFNLLEVPLNLTTNNFISVKFEGSWNE